MGNWRKQCSPIIAKVIAENKGKTIREIKAALRKAYPFGQKKYWPYKVWLSEIKHQLPKMKPDEIPPDQTTFLLREQK